MKKTKKKIAKKLYDPVLGYKPKFIDTPLGKSEVIMQQQGNKVKVFMPKWRYEELVNKNRRGR